MDRQENKSFWLSRDDIKYHFDTFIFGFIYNDIDQCIKAKANYVVALALLSYTEYIGGLISGNLGLKNKGKANFNKALEYFLDEYRSIDSSLKVEYKDENGETKSETGIYALFRCGLVHEYFIKGIPCTVVSNNPDGHTKEHIGIRISASGGANKKLEFYTNEYFRDFKSAVEKIYKKLIVDSDPDLLTGFNKSLNRISSRRIT